MLSGRAWMEFVTVRAARLAWRGISTNPISAAMNVIPAAMLMMAQCRSAFRARAESQAYLAASVTGGRGRDGVAAARMMGLGWCVEDNVYGQLLCPVEQGIIWNPKKGREPDHLRQPWPGMHGAQSMRDILCLMVREPPLCAVHLWAL